jgi:hypothetical protein
MEDNDIYAEARKKVQAKKGFFYHLLAYVFTIGLLYTIMYFANGGDIFVVLITAISWGIGIVTHYFKVFGTEQLGFLGINPDWEEDALEKEVERLERKMELREYIKRETELMDDADGLKLKEIEKRRLER